MHVDDVVSNIWQAYRPPHHRSAARSPPDSRAWRMLLAPVPFDSRDEASKCVGDVAWRAISACPAALARLDTAGIGNWYFSNFPPGSVTTRRAPGPLR